MSASVEKKDRKVIPRWRCFPTTVGLGELGSAAEAARDDSAAVESVREKRDAWISGGTLWHATDFLGAALVWGRPQDAIDAARSVLKTGSKAPITALKVASRLLGQLDESPDVLTDSGPSHEEKLREQIHALRYRCQEYPRNAIAWVDLALAYTVLGLQEKAERAICTALSISPTNRFVLRSAARFYVHNHDPERAFRILHEGDATANDPWLLAAEIAVGSAAGKSQRATKASRSLLQGGRFPPWQLSELASAVATDELEAGHHIAAKKLFRNALIAPTENSVAQVEWASEHLPGLTVRPRELKVPRLFEARAWQSFSGGDWADALQSSLDWYYDQQFSSRPAALASYINCMVFEDYEKTADLLRKSLVANPRDSLLLNNLAYSLACMGDVKQAEGTLAEIDSDHLDEPTRVSVAATKGLVHFRKGLIVEGRKLYRDAIEQAHKHSLDKLAAMATILLAREEVRSRTEFSRTAVREAIEESKDRPEADVVLYLGRLKTLADSHSTREGEDNGAGARHQR